MLGRLFSAAAIVMGLSMPTTAQTFPDRPITLIVPFAAGGPSDVLGRLIGQSMSATLGQSVLIENVGGAGGTTGAARTARAAADGYTLLIHHLALAAGATLYRNLSYDTLRDFEPIGLINQGPFVIVSKNGLETKTIAEFLDHVKKTGKGISFGTAGVGSGSHLCNMMLQAQLKVQFNEIPYRGTGPAMNDLVAGQLDALCDQTTNSIPQIQGGRIRAYAVTALQRVEQLPSLPTLHEAGLPNFEVTVWHALYAPRGTPAPVVQRLSAALETALKDPAILARFADLGTTAYPAGQRGPAEARAKLESEVAKWRQVITDSGFTPTN
ncbi:tripartite tricarboxylate transporter substrate-binding protein [Phreatobacter oligotrophus]|jgi:tripartite-type tricarboxylate transporter receptor subunit TctC|uniref:tripartite tricarboxylate transporter substrate-binding protein n=1 Tax=Phreatobacter oligotrophus TaxID=1122261 RepID=UPI0023574610|nr:tripartite tricarboxylate transporter substrate-binding protein [Phreatobacter oligotrophus]MBX9991485.1 tripartite tricarboxylate transporter substrate binding protein BugD [Phreatobacter oligotrophus]